MVQPGPSFAVADVHRGWCRGLASAGAQVCDLGYADRLSFYEHAREALLGEKVCEDAREMCGLIVDGAAVKMAGESLMGAVFKLRPDTVIVTSGFFVDEDALDTIRANGVKVVLLATESPYQDDWQLDVASHCDLAILNDPTNLDAYRDKGIPAHYIPHAYDPDVHKPGLPDPDLVSDFCLIGTGFGSRIAFLEQVDFSGLDVKIGGTWPVDDGHPLAPFIVNEPGTAIDNDKTARFYASTRASVNLYRREAERPELSAGWSMGPREVELAACGTFFLRDHRPEGDQVLPMLPTFDSPGEFAEKLRWWLAHDSEREAVAARAREAIADRTFDANARTLMRLLEPST